ncbi:DUF262 domain-containing HNH endonuclease family protein [Aggregatibacter segnis]|uniref:DUF262 domain-containing protein n=1 Tax=Aggregatibacter segnis TaxID=739 RepID=UPI0028F02002|nr:DUF262 domain-containing HNH endonuclease family protein [Aggregatibacter segnis]
MSLDVFKPENLSIEQVFGNADSFYQMPEYQRPYSWDKERVEQLWFDLVEAYKNYVEDPAVDSNYFLGSLVVVKNGQGYDVIDGQQRMTTLTILFCVLRDLDKLNLPDTRMNKVKHSIKDLLGGKERLKLTTQLNNQALFETSVINKIDFQASKSKIEENRFLQTAFYFKNLIEESQNSKSYYYIDDLSGFIKYIFEQTTLIRVVCYDESFAIKLFTVLNDRGLDLASSDIIKAYLLQKLSEDKRSSFVEVWKRVETICKQAGESLQMVLSLYLYYLKSGNPKKNLHEELKLELKSKEPIETILFIEEFAKNLSEINYDYQDKDISKLRYLPQSIYWKTILLAAKQVNYPFYHELKNLLVRYYYQSWIADGTSNRIKQTSFNILRMVKEGRGILDIKKEIMGNLNIYENYLLSLDRNNIYSFKWHKPLLLAIEYHQQDNYQFIEINKDLHTEHILPKEWKNNDLNWKDVFSDDDARKYLNSLGNLTLLSGPKNIRASNRDYLNKKEIYNGKGLDGKTSFEITKKIMEDSPNEWNVAEIVKRKNWLINQVKEILDIK